MARVFNRHKGAVPKGAVSIERGSKYGNPFIIGVHGDRPTCIRRFRMWAYRPEQKEFRQMVRDTLKGVDLVCVCDPLPCHGHVLIEIAEGEEE